MTHTLWWPCTYTKVPPCSKLSTPFWATYHVDHGLTTASPCLGSWPLLHVAIVERWHQNVPPDWRQTVLYVQAHPAWVETHKRSVHLECFNYYLINNPLTCGAHTCAQWPTNWPQPTTLPLLNEAINLISYTCMHTPTFLNTVRTTVTAWHRATQTVFKLTSCTH